MTVENRSKISTYIVTYYIIRLRWNNHLQFEIDTLAYMNVQEIIPRIIIRTLEYFH